MIPAEFEALDGMLQAEGYRPEDRFEILHSATEIGGSWDDPEDALSGHDAVVFGVTVRGGRHAFKY
jgi:hypothetical protein